MGGDNSGKRRINEKAAIKSQKRASQTGNCGSVLLAELARQRSSIAKEIW